MTVEPLEPGDPRAIGQCRIQARIATGGMANVYLGRSAGGRAVAVKVMHDDFAGQQDYTDRFRREVAALRAVGGGHNPAVLEADPDAAEPWLATEFVPSVTLRDAVRMCGPLTAQSVWPLAAGVAEAMSAIHRAGFVHLDLTPANVMLTRDGPRVIDFGIARELDPDGFAVTGTPAGSQGFMSPEQLAGGQVGPASDVFSFAAMVTYACTGTAPGVGAGPAGADGISDDALRSLVADCLRDDPSTRPTVPELIAALGSLTRDGQISDRLWLPPAVTAGIDRSADEAVNPPAAVRPGGVRPVAVPPGDARQDDLPPAAQMPTPDGERPTRRWIARSPVLVGVAAAIAAAVVTAAAVGIGTSVSSEPREPSDSLASTSEPGAPRSTTKASPSTPSPTGSPTPTESPTPSASRTPRILEFRFTGDGTLTNLTYIVNGRSKTVKDVELPWRVSIDLPQAPEQFEWQLAYQVAGNMEYRVLQDGADAGSGWSTGGEGTAGGTLVYRPTAPKAGG
ncbi:protein kinase [Actinopolymorpha sp. B17G11]|uniref:serine/threonine-protein kinase n=1 Tax=Actinopolymorpha sp. B17G11 TaxID=3160861 RepID=UPI0032E3E6C1